MSGLKVDAVRTWSQTLRTGANWLPRVSALITRCRDYRTCGAYACLDMCVCLHTHTHGRVRTYMLAQMCSVKASSGTKCFLMKWQIWVISIINTGPLIVFWGSSHTDSPALLPLICYWLLVLHTVAWTYDFFFFSPLSPPPNQYFVFNSCSSAAFVSG